jgi:hypothetical protein
VGLHARSPVASVRGTGTPPIVGATLLALDSAGAGREVQERARAEVMAAAVVSDG